MTFSVPETARLLGCLRRLRPHLREDVALTGGVAIEWILNAADRTSGRETVADLDFVARSLGAVAPTVVGDFLVCHYHVPKEGRPKFLLMLVDPLAGMRVDIFPDLASSLGSARRQLVGGEDLLVLTASAILDHKLKTLARASAANHVDEKHQRDALALAQLCGREVPALPRTAFAKDVYSKDLKVLCPRCEESREPGFPLASKQEIHDVLGYV